MCVLTRKLCRLVSSKTVNNFNNFINFVWCILPCCHSQISRKLVKQISKFLAHCMKIWLHVLYVRGNLETADEDVAVCVVGWSGRAWTLEAAVVGRTRAAAERSMGHHSRGTADWWQRPSYSTPPPGQGPPRPPPTTPTQTHSPSGWETPSRPTTRWDGARAARWGGYGNVDGSQKVDGRRGVIWWEEKP